MNTKTIVAAVIALTAAAAQADDPTPDPYQGQLGTRIRAEVVAERDAAIRSGEIHAMTGEDSGSHLLEHKRPVIWLSRAQVRAEVLAAMREGVLDVMHGEDSGSTYLSRNDAVPSAAQRFAQLRR